MSWQALADAAPDLAAFGSERLHDQVAYFGTLKPDGSPRLHPVRPAVAGGRLFVFTEGTSPKVRDLERNGRYALHATATGDEPWDLREFAGEGVSAVSTMRPHGRPPTPAVPSTRRALSAVRAGVEMAMSTVYGADGRPRRERWRFR